MTAARQSLVSETGAWCACCGGQTLYSPYVPWIYREHLIHETCWRPTFQYMTVDEFSSYVIQTEISVDPQVHTFYRNCKDKQSRAQNGCWATGLDLLWPEGQTGAGQPY